MESKKNLSSVHEKEIVNSLGLYILKNLRLCHQVKIVNGLLSQYIKY